VRRGPVSGRGGLTWHRGGHHAALTVAMATSWGRGLVGQEWPAVTMLGFSSGPSRYMWWSDNTWGDREMTPTPSFHSCLRLTES